MSSHSDPEATQPQQPLSGSLGLEATSAPFLASSTAENQGALTALLRAIRLSQGQFSLVLAHCNYETLRDRVIKALCQEADLSLGFVHLPPETYSLLAALKAGSADLSPPSRQPPAQNPDQNLTQNPDQNLADAQVQSSAQNLDQNLTKNPNQTSAQTQALVVLGLDQVSEVAQVLKAANQVREEFRRALPFAVVVWVNDSIFKQLMRQAPDLENWATPIHFTLSSAALLQQIQHATDAIFAQILEAGAGRFVNAVNVYPDGQGDGQIEALSAARRSLERARIQPDALLEASLEFVLGQATWSQPAVSRQHYERSLALWPAEQSLSRRGCVLFHLGLWWRADAVRHRERYTEACERSRDYFQQAIATFRRSHRFDLEARFINALAEVLQRLEQWPELEQVARRSLTLHQQGVELASLEAGQFDPSVRLAHDHGLLADVALSQDQWPMAQHHAEQALDILEQVDRAVDGAIAAKSYRPDDTLNWARAYHRQQYHFSLARALLGQNNYHSAITQLEIAQRLGNPQHDPLLYIRIAKQLRALYYQQKRYLEAFHIRQVYRTVEQQYGLRAFTGAGRLRPQQSVQSPALAVTNEPETIPLEIVAAGRQADVEHLMQRIYRPDCKLTVIYGQSGVGKSSMIAAGLMPMLQQQVVGSREVVPILLQIYDQWPKQLGEAVAIALFGHGTSALSASSGSADQESDEDEPTRLLIESAPAILAQLRVSTKNNRFMVLVFDQFEEFFAAAPSLAQQRRFYQFLEKCLALPYVKVVLSLREDYIHNLLECNRRVNLDIIDNNILDKSILYYIGNFSKASAHQLIYQLTRQAQFHLEPALIERLVEDLAEDLTGELGEVRPIELQVLGDQLQTENITTLAQYEHCGDGDRSPKAVLMDRYLDSVIRDCGEENR
ncbi:MAG: AAA family ATPase, partial [Cyanobacteria bacterium P01_H01_bin.119]